MTACLIGLSDSKSGPHQPFCWCGSSAKPQGDMKSLPLGHLGTHGNVVPWWNYLFKEMSVLSFVNFIKIKKCIFDTLKWNLCCYLCCFSHESFRGLWAHRWAGWLPWSEGNMLGLASQCLVPSVLSETSLIGIITLHIKEDGPRGYPCTSPSLRVSLIHPCLSSP